MSEREHAPKPGTMAAEEYVEVPPLEPVWPDCSECGTSIWHDGDSLWCPKCYARWDGVGPPGRRFVEPTPQEDDG